MNALTSSSRTTSRKLVGVGYRVRRRTDPRPHLVLDVGKSHAVTFVLPAGVTASIDASGTKCVRSYTPASNDPLALRQGKERLGNTAHLVMRLRPRSPYTGNGIVLDGVEYPKLKSTKTKAKK